MTDPKQFNALINHIICGDALTVLKTLPADSIDCIVTSPPYYGLRDYNVSGQLGLESGFGEYLLKVLAITAELRRVLKPTGTMWWDHGDSYGTGSGAGIRTGKQATNRGTQTNERWQKHGKPQVLGYDKSLLLQPYRLAQRMIDEQGWILRNIIIWHKPNCMPSSVKDRFTVDYEPVFFFTKSKRYWFEMQYEKRATDPEIDLRRILSQRRGSGKHTQGRVMSYRNTLSPANILPRATLGRSKRCVWTIATHPYPDAHFATYPPRLIEIPIKAGCPEFICKACGVARERLFDVDYIPTGRRASGKTRGRSRSNDLQMGCVRPDEMRLGEATKLVSYAGLTDCGCNAGFEPGIVLDPFLGSGTTALVARTFNRHFLGIELNPVYCRLAEKRLQEFAPHGDLIIHQDDALSPHAGIRLAPHPRVRDFKSSLKPGAKRARH